VRLEVRRAIAADAPLVHRFVVELAEFERMADQVRAGEADLRAMLFCAAPRAFCEILEMDGEGAGFALWFYNLSTFEGRHGLFLEDLYVCPAMRGRGGGRALLRALARRCVEEGLARLEWAVLDWNAEAIAFYDRMGAEAKDGWTARRLSGGALRMLAEA